MVNNRINKYLNKLSVVVLSYNKELSLKALVNYWSKYPIELIILDGSNKKINLTKKNHNPNFKLKYFYEPKSYSERIKKATYIVSREYSLLSADDEIHLPRGIARSIKFLDRNTEFNSSMGRCNLVYKTKNKLKIRKAYLKLENVNSTQIHENMEDRVFHYFNDYICATFYSVIRSHDWKRNVRNSFSISISCPFAIERLFEFTNIAHGKCHVHNNVSWIRNGINPPVADSGGVNKNLNRSNTLNRWMKMKSKSIKKEYDDIKKLMRNYGVKKENISFMFSHIFREIPKKQTLINQLRRFLMNIKILRKIKIIIKFFINFILKFLYNKGKLKKIDKYLSLNKDEIYSINKFIFEEQGIVNLIN